MYSGNAKEKIVNWRYIVGNAELKNANLANICILKFRIFFFAIFSFLKVNLRLYIHPYIYTRHFTNLTIFLLKLYMLFLSIFSYFSMNLSRLEMLKITWLTLICMKWVPRDPSTIFLTTSFT